MQLKKPEPFNLKVNKFQNENMKSSHCPKHEWKILGNGTTPNFHSEISRPLALCLKYEQKKLKNSALSVQGRIFQIFCSCFGQWDDYIFSF